MRVLYIAPYGSYSGYSHAALSNILALDSVGVDVACRHLNTIPRTRPTSDKIRELESNNFSSYDFCIQHIPPYMFSYDAKAGVNVGIFYIETEPMPKLWSHYCDLLDLYIAPSKYDKEVIQGSVNKPVELCGIPNDVEKYKKQYTCKAAENIRDGNFLFYTIGELVARKNLAGLIRAFYSEFDLDEPVKLIIKTGLVGVDNNKTKNKVEDIINIAKDNLRIYWNPKMNMEQVILGSMTDDELCGLHQACDCFVQPSRGESWSIPAMDGMAFGKTPIVSACGGFLEYVNDKVGWLIPTRKEPVSGDWSVHPELYNSRQSWHSPDLLSLRKSMREAYENEDLRKNKGAAGVLKAYEFSYQIIGNQLKSILEKHGK